MYQRDPRWTYTFVKFDVWDFSENLPRKYKFVENRVKMSDTLTFRHRASSI
jgi:hypothetical protein